ncbi:MAG: beta-ketoacyl-ACP synthase II [Gammaproteobacteria bacterium]|nr:beta-ketoacyl-ACP synthase II [Gammaproteobacteria bacterium]
MVSRRRVVVTGLGIVSPVGSSTERAWANITAGKSGISRIDCFDASAFSVQIAGQTRDFNADDYLSKKDQRKMDPFIHYGIGAAVQAIEDSGFEVTEEKAERIGVAIGSGIGGLPGIEKSNEAYLKSGPKKVSPFFVPSNIINMVSGNLSIMRGFRGPNVSIVSACSTGTHNIGDAARMIAFGDADIMVAGGAEMATCPLGIGGFAAARALCSSHNDDPEAASRPFDLDRDGFVLGDGAGVLVLEEYELARARSARIYCELVGYGMNSDAYHMTSPAKGGLGASRCMQNALNDAKLDVTSVDYVNAHGTSTPAGDLAETDAIKCAFGGHSKQLAVSSTKSMTGHLLGAAGGVEALFTVLAVYHGILPPTINYDTPDPGCDLDYVPNEARVQPINVAISNSFGFGGTNATVVFQKV